MEARKSKITYSRLPGVSAREEEAALDATYAYLLDLADRLGCDGSTQGTGDERLPDGEAGSSDG